MTCRYAYDATRRELRLNLSQARAGTGGVFMLPFSFAAADASGRDIPETVHTIRFDTPEKEFTVSGIPEPAFLSINRDVGFYGTCTDLSATPPQLAQQVRLDSNAFNRVEAMRRLTDLERRRLLANPAATVSVSWLDVYRRVITSTSVSDGIKGYLLKIDEQPLDRTLLPHVRESYIVRQRLLRAAALACGETTILNTLQSLSDTAGAIHDLPAAIERRFVKSAFLQLLVGLKTTAAHETLEELLTQPGSSRSIQRSGPAWRSANITDRLNTLTALWQSGHPNRHAILMREGASLRQTLGGYLGYLQVIGQSPRDEMFDAVLEEERRPTFSLSHPGLSRALYVPLSLNNAQLWTPRGLRVMTDTVIKLAPISEFTTLRLIAPFQAYPSFAPDLRDAVKAALSEMRAALKKAHCLSVAGRIEAYLTGP
ncbi:MAG: aminopeptidase N C-terminal domain-containing protein [bacterium]